MATLAEIYDWFMTGKKPTQAQFWASWGSFWNKSESIPQSAVSNLTTTLNAKAEKTQFDAHKTAADAHQALFDLKQSLSEKGQENGYAPLNEFTQIAAAYLNIVDDLVTGGATALASAETVKTLKGQIDAINLILTSDNVNMDNVQEIVDAIETVQTSLETILVNDLTTGGTTKALTAEMGKSLKSLIDSLDSDVIHKNGDETKTGNFNIDGLVGIKQVAPEASLHIGDGDAIILDRYKDGFDAGPNFLGRAYNGTKSSPMPITDNQIIAVFGANPYNGIDAENARAWLKFLSNGLQSAINRGTKVDISITPLNNITPSKSVFNADSERVLLSDALNGNTAPVAVGWFGKGEIPGENPHKFQVVSDGLNPTVSFGQFGGADAGNAGGHLWASRGTASAPTAIKSGDYLWSWGFRGQGATKRAPSSANMSIRATEDFTDAAHGTEILFGTNAAGHDANLGRTSVFKMGDEGTFSAPKLMCQSFSAGQLGSVKFNNHTHANSRSWLIANDYDEFGDFVILQSTTQNGTTYSKKIQISPSGEVGVLGGLTAEKFKLSALNTPPSSATDIGTLGEVRITAGFIFVCIATNIWVRASLSTW